ncbi:hypothetical protein E2C01_002085 [Portunus trituberculatus]|uniref:Uncharacterized protein n=1 Tax=Portunus trituberculatus TaxID=210409 RepID=A0A5B7CL70_PORTR|nr:hypothetical protein [Portunus trituberculatus]
MKSLEREYEMCQVLTSNSRVNNVHVSVGWVSLWHSAPKELEYENLGFALEYGTLSVVEALHHIMHSEVIVVRGVEGGVVTAVTHEHNNARIHVVVFLHVAEIPQRLNGVLHNKGVHGGARLLFLTSFFENCLPPISRHGTTDTLRRVRELTMEFEVLGSGHRQGPDASPSSPSPAPEESQGSSSDCCRCRQLLPLPLPTKPPIAAPVPSLSSNSGGGERERWSMSASVSTLRWQRL